MFGQKALRTLICLTAFLALSACVPIARTSSTDVTASATANETAGRITGYTWWGSALAPAALVDLRPRAQSEDPATTVQQVAADSNGAYVLENVPAGEYILVGQWPDGTENPARRSPVNLDAGAVVTDVNIYLERPLNLLEPDSGAETTTQPHLAWEPFPDAVQYRVWVIDAGTTALLFNPTLAAVETTVEPPLEPGHTYTLEVQALDAAGAIVASAKREFRVKA